MPLGWRCEVEDSESEEENAQSPKQGFIAAPGSLDVHVWLSEILPAIPWMV